MAMLIVDYQGKPVTRHSCCSKYCTLVRSIQPLNDLYQCCDSRGGLEAARLTKPYIYMCHMGLLDLAIPIVVKGHYIGAILAGQVFLQPETGNVQLEKIVDSHNYKLTETLNAQLEKLSLELPVMTLDRVQVVANMLFQITNYIVEEALTKITLNETWEESMAQMPAPVSIPTLQANARVKRPVYNSIIIRPAIDYIQKNYEKHISLDEMASLCNISSSYFSKLFNRIAGDNFANYINQVRISYACELLIMTDKPITHIALDLGYEDSSYFNKVFKRIIGVSPSVYKATQLQH